MGLMRKVDIIFDSARLNLYNPNLTSISFGNLALEGYPIKYIGKRPAIA